MFQRFTARAREVVVLAQDEARDLLHNYIGTEHILLGLLGVRDGVAAKALGDLGISAEKVRAEVEAVVGRGQAAPTGHIPFTPRAKKCLELALRQALKLGHGYIGTEHILLGLLAEGEGLAVQILTTLGADKERTTEEIFKVLGDPGARALLSKPRLRARARRVVVGLFSGHRGGDPSSAPAHESRDLVLGQMAAVFDENDRLRGEVDRLRALLQSHGIDPDGGEAKTA